MGGGVHRNTKSATKIWGGGGEGNRLTDRHFGLQGSYTSESTKELPSLIQVFFILFVKKNIYLLDKGICLRRLMNAIFSAAIRSDKNSDLTNTM